MFSYIKLQPIVKGRELSKKFLFFFDSIYYQIENPKSKKHKQYKQLHFSISTILYQTTNFYLPNSTAFKVVLKHIHAF